MNDYKDHSKLELNLSHDELREAPSAALVKYELYRHNMYYVRFFFSLQSSSKRMRTRWCAKVGV